jgi:hypothetical protein
LPLHGIFRASVRHAGATSADHTDACQGEAAQGTDNDQPQAGSHQTAEDDGGEPGVAFLARWDFRVAETENLFDTFSSLSVPASTFSAVPPWARHRPAVAFQFDLRPESNFKSRGTCAEDPCRAGPWSGRLPVSKGVRGSVVVSEQLSGISRREDLSRSLGIRPSVC